MIDPALLREQPQQVAANLARRGVVCDCEKFAQLDNRLRELRTEVEQLRAERNKLSGEIGRLRQAERPEQSENREQLEKQASAIGDQLSEQSALLSDAQQRHRDFLLALPNLLHDDVPDGSNENDNRTVFDTGHPEAPDFKVKDHVELGLLHGNGIDLETAGAMSRSRFVVLAGSIARLHRALGQYMLDKHTAEHGYTECHVPLLVNTQALTNTGQLPRFSEDEDQIFSCANDDLHLIPTSEVSLGNMAANRTFKPEELPLRLVAHSACFRREAGSYGKDTRGMLRQHQFDKVELLQVTHPDKSWEAHEEIRANAESILADLELPYRVVDKCVADIGSAAARTYDLEVWLPSQNTYREISSISNDTDFQARRMKARVRSGKGKPAFVHILNGSGLAVGRSLIAVIENCQDAAGSIRIPKVLQKYFDGSQVIQAPA